MPEPPTHAPIPPAIPPATSQGSVMDGLRQPAWRVAMVLVAIGGTLVFLQWARVFLVPLTIGVVLAFALNPLVVWLQRWYVPRPIASALVVLGLWIGGAAIVFGMQDGISAMAARIPIAAGRVAESVDRLRNHVGGAFDTMREVTVALEHAAEGVQGKPPPPPPKRGPAGLGEPPNAAPVLPVREFLWTGSANLFALAGQIVVVSFLVYFLLASGQALKRKWVRAVGRTLSEKKRAVRMMAGIGTQIQYSLLVLFVTNIVLGVVTAVAFVLLGMENAAVWGLASAILHFVPYLGSAVIAVASGVGAYLQMGALSDALVVAGTTLLLATLIGTLLVTWLQSRASKLDPCVVYIGLLLWGWLWGVWGLLLGTSVTAMIKVVCDHVERLRPLGTLLGTTDAPAGVSQRVLDRLRGRPTRRPERPQPH
ncbi:MULTISPECIES: AI-2E family transporter [Ralstonia]|uniref:AI-2E family transporter n=1 Tax=Ralstonia TaxID=48736 RepID=UPI0005DA627B|nr:MULTISPECIES: AI-2E family transporter [Ralstonia]AJW47482.1 permease [Ralstonia mannitolilytica]PLT18383.1 AI-2E family transporter [Ralstonia mannitolilytica]QIF10193.1 AI-2E family transporter [Ralstonia mannitolilytica]